MLASDLPIWFVRLFTFMFGALWGSFANVVIYRWPREMSVVQPGSHCVGCGKPVRSYDNVPIFAWFWLRGRCRDCGTKISPRYVIVELIFAVISMAIGERTFGVSAADLPLLFALAHYVVRFGVAFALLVATFIDLDEMIVPWFIKWFAPVPLAAAWFLPPLEPTASGWMALAGAAGGYLGLRVLFIDGYKLLTGHRGMGLGDAEILFLVGALLGPAGVVFSLGAGSVQGVIAAGIALLAQKRIGPAHADEIEDEDEDEDDTDDEVGTSQKGNGIGPATRAGKIKVPFVPFLALAALEYLLGADVLVNEYLQLIRGA